MPPVHWSGRSTRAGVRRIAEESFYDLDAPVEQVCSTEVPIPYARQWEEAALPQTADIVAAAHRAVDGAVGARCVNRTDALNVVKESIAQVIPDADLATLGPDEAFRDALEMDSLDFLTYIEILGERTGMRIDDEDTPQLTTLSGSADFLVAHGK
ncbi:phosphopantetheine-binding protein [Streptomyces sp. INA 01156]